MSIPTAELLSRLEFKNAGLAFRGGGVTASPRELSRGQCYHLSALDIYQLWTRQRTGYSSLINNCGRQDFDNCALVLRQGKVSVAQQSPPKEVEPSASLTQPARLSHPVKK